MKKVLSIILALSMVVQAAFCCVAFGEDAETQKTIKVTFTDASGNVEELEFTGTVTVTEEGTYVINSDIALDDATGLSSYAADDKKISIEVIDHNIEGSSGVILNGKNIVFNMKGNVTAKEYNAIGAYEGTKITLVGDVTSEGEYNTSLAAADQTVVDITGNVISNGDGDAVFVRDQAEVTVSENVTSFGNGVHIGNTYMYDPDTEKSKEITNQAVVVVGGDINAGHTETYTDNEGNEYSYASGSGAYVEGEGQLSVTGDITSVGTGISIYDDATVIVDGNVISKDSNGIYNSNPEEYDEENKTWVETEKTNATIVVGGDITAGDGAGVTVDGNTTALVGGDITADYAGVDANDESKVTVSGSVTSLESTAVLANGDTVVHVSGDVAGETGVSIYDGSKYNYEEKEYQDYENAAVVTVDGSINGGGTGTGTDSEGNTYTYETGAGASVSGEGQLTVGKDVNSKATGVSAWDSANIIVNGDINADTTGINIHNSSIWNSETQKNESTVITDATVTVKGDVNAGDAGHVEGNSTLVVGGDITSKGDGLDIIDNAEVTVGGNVKAENGTAIQNYCDWDYDEETEKSIRNETAAKIIVDGDITSSHGRGVETSGQTTAEIGGNVTAEYNGVSANEESIINVSGSVTSVNATAVSANGDTVIHVTGDVTGDTGVSIYDSSKYNYEEQEYQDYENAAVVTVDGSINGGGTGTGTYSDGTTYTYKTGSGANLSGEGQLIVGKDINSKSSGISITDSADVVVNGSIKAEGQGINAYNTKEWNSETEAYETKITDATVTVKGDVSSEDGSGVRAGGKSKITVGGDISSQYSGIDVSENGIVDVAGSVVSEEGTGISLYNSGNYNAETQKYETIYNSGSVSVGGDVKAYSDGINANGNAVVTVNGMVEAGHENYWTDESGEKHVYGSGDGISAEDNSVVEVKGQTTSYGTGIRAYDDSTVVASGDVTSKEDSGIDTMSWNTVYNSETDTYDRVLSNANVSVDGNVNAYETGINASGTSKVTVDGSVSAGHMETGNVYYTDEDGNTVISRETYANGEGISATDKAEVNVTGDVTAYSTGISAYNYNNEDTLEQEYEDVENGCYIYRTIKHTYTPTEAVVNVDGNVTSLTESGSGIFAAGNSKITVDGNVANLGENESGINAYGNSTVDVSGNVTSGSDGIWVQGTYTTEETVKTVEFEDYETDSYITIEYEVIDQKETDSNATVNVSGDVNAKWMGVSVGGTSTVNIGGNVNAEITGAESYGDAILNIGGDINAENGTALNVYGDAHAAVGGDVESEHSTAIYMDGNSTAIIEGDVAGGDFEPVEEELTEEQKAEREEMLKREAAIEKLFDDVAQQDYVKGAVQINTTEDGDNAGSLVVKGTITSEGDSVPLVINVYTDEKETDDYDLPKEMPEIIVDEIEANENGEYFGVNMMVYTTRLDEETEQEYDRNLVMDISEEQETEIKEAIAQAIQYIIHVVNPENGTISTSGTTYDEEKDLNLAHEGDSIGVLVAAQDGYNIESVDAGNAQIIDNGNGTWTVIVNRGGGVTISATIQKKYKPIKKVTEEQIVAEESKLEFKDVEIPEEGVKLNGTVVKSGEKASDAMIKATKNLNNTNYTVVTVVGVSDLMNEEENKTFKSLKTTEKVMIALTLLGEDQQVEEQAAANKKLLSEKAQTLCESIKARIEAMSETEKAAFIEEVKKAFQTEKITVDGKEVEAYVIELRIGRSNSTIYQKYYFIEKDGTLVLCKVAEAKV